MEALRAVSLHVGRARPARTVRAASARCLEHCLEHCLELGGRPYLYGWHVLNESALQRIFGLHLDRLRQLQNELDPDGIFQRGKLLPNGESGPR